MEAGELEVEKHAHFILTVEKRNADFEALAMEHLRMNGAYWGLTTLYLLHRLDAVDPDEVLSWVLECQHDSGGFAGNIGHDPHILYTLSAIQVLALLDKLDVLDSDKVSNYDKDIAMPQFMDVMVNSSEILAVHLFACLSYYICVEMALICTSNRETHKLLT